MELLKLMNQVAALMQTVKDSPAAKFEVVLHDKQLIARPRTAANPAAFQICQFTQEDIRLGFDAKKWSAIGKNLAAALSSGALS